MALSRRQVLIGTGAGGALIIAYALTPRRFALPLEPRTSEFAFGPWIKIAKDGMVSVAVPQLEMGQGISTLLPQIAAWELGADWQRVAVEPAPTSGAYANAPLAEKWASLWMPMLPALAEEKDSALARSFAERNRFTATADGLSLAAYEMPLRLAAAAAREVLAMAAADVWGTDASACKVENGYVTSAKGKLPFARLVSAAANIRLPRAPVLRAGPPQERPHEFPVGKPPGYPRLDGPSKVTGGATFAGDIRLPGMVFAAIAHGPQGDTRLAGHDAARIAGLSGNVRLVTNERWIAAVASNWWSANRALEVLGARFATSHAAEITNIEPALSKALKRAPTFRIATTGDAKGVIGDKPSLALRYDISPALHASIETASCTAQLRGGICEIWLASQAPEQARRAVAEALGMSVSDVILYPVIAGGSFDARLEHGHAVQAALIAREVGKPVQLTWSRWQEHLAGLPRMPAAAMLWAKTAGQGGQILALRTRIAAPSAGWEFGRRLFDGDAPRDAMVASAGKADPLAVEGATPPYALANFALDHVPVQIDLPAGRMRGQAHGFTAFFTECFIDELAHAAHREPLSYRMEMIGNDPRLGLCLQRVSALAQWNGGNDASGQGLACHRIGPTDSGGCIAVIVTARRTENGVMVDKIAAAVDIGRVVNIDIARQQIEGGLIFGLGLAVGGATGYGEGLPFVGRLSGLGLPLLGTTPEIEIDFIDSDAAAADPGELGVAAIAPAIANALFSATGLRFRRLPLMEEAE